MPCMAEILPALAQALLQDGDARLEPVDSGGRNRYGCTVEPDPELLQLGSSTASTISEAGWQAAQHMHGDWLAQGSRVVLADSVQLIHRQLLELLQCPPDTRLCLTASGTDAHRLLVRSAYSDRMLCLVMPEAGETGSGVAQALAHRGVARIHQYRLRDQDGRPESAEAMRTEIEPWIRAAIRDGLRVLLVQTDVSKTGLMAPQRALVDDWRHAFGDALLLAVDACQLRMPPGRVAARLALGEAVLLTGSKFMSGPSFSGALLLPSGTCWQTMSESEQRPGMLLRWAAAVREMHDLVALPEQSVMQAMCGLTGVISGRLAKSTRLRWYPARQPEILAGESPGAWQQLPSLFVVGLQDAQGQLLDEAQVRSCYQRMQIPLSAVPGGEQRVLVGQPVWCGQEQGKPALALRLAISSRMLVDAVTLAGGQSQLEQRIARAMDKLDWLVGRLGCNG